MKLFLSIIGNLILFFLIITGFLIAFPMSPVKNGFKIYFVSSGSMEPTIKTGSMVVVKPQSQYYVDDIITFSRILGDAKNGITTHRILKIDRSDSSLKYTTKGDANSFPDSDALSDKNIIGKMVFSIPYIGYLVGYLKTFPGLILIVVVPATIIIFEEIKKINLEIKKITKRKKLKT